MASTYTKERGDYVCDIVATHTISINKLFDMYRDKGFVSLDTITAWRHKFPEFSHAFLEAKKFQAMLYVEQSYEIADDASRDLIETDKGLAVNSSAVARAKLQIETRRWVVARLLPRLYGEKTYVENNVHIRHEDALDELE